MSIVNHILLPPTIQHFELLPWIVQLLLVIHLPFLGTLLFASLFSLIFTPFDRKLALAFIRILSSNGGVWLIFGVLPSLCLPFLFGQIWHSAVIPIAWQLEVLSYLSICGQCLLFISSRTGWVAACVPGHVIIGLSCFAYVYLMSYLSDPGQWISLGGKLSFVHLAHATWCFGQFVAAAAIVAGGVITLFKNKAPTLMRRIGSWLPLGGAILLPPLLILDVFTVPSSTLSASGLGLAGLLLAVIFSYVMYVKFSPHKWPVLTLIIGFFAFIIFGLRLGGYQITANVEARSRVSHTLKATHEAHAAEQAKRYTKTIANPALGKEIFETRCNSCHEWHEQVVGPPFSKVIPKYINDKAKLAEFIRKPTKINPDYPPMPKPGLNETEIEAIVSFLTTEVSKP